jgi:asparagine synthase (glutamine-hydrolysing)
LRESKIHGWFGQECRPPFLDRDVLDYAMNEIHPIHKMCGRFGGGRPEKWILREAYKHMLPEDVYTRTKMQYSDGIGSLLIDTITKHAMTQVSADELKDAASKYKINVPTTPEMVINRIIFDQEFPHPCSILTVPGGKTIACSSPAAMAWDAEFEKSPDDSGRSVKIDSPSVPHIPPTATTTTTTTIAINTPSAPGAASTTIMIDVSIPSPATRTSSSSSSSASSSTSPIP